VIATVLDKASAELKAGIALGEGVFDTRLDAPLLADSVELGTADDAREEKGVLDVTELDEARPQLRS
jgi:hypothetical protein